MIKIMRYGQVPNSEIFARGIDQANVEDIVTDILANVKIMAMRHSAATAASLTDSQKMNLHWKYPKQNLMQPSRR